MGTALRLYAGACLLSAAALLSGLSTLRAQKRQIEWSDREKPILDQMRKLRSLPDEERVTTTKRLAVQIRQLPGGSNKEMLAESLAGLVTEGDPGVEALQEVATTLGQALREQAAGASASQANPAALHGYITLAQLVRYEHVQASLDGPEFAAAMAKLEADDRSRQSAEFTLSDLNGKRWTLKDLHGSVVLVNFWATWCPPCRKEIPDLEVLNRRFGTKGLVILAISDEESGKVQPFVAERHIGYPVLLDPGRKVNELFRIEGIPKTFVYDREGKLAAQAIDMRTQRQFLEMLAQAGLQ